MNEAITIARRVQVSGRVQGVGFRWSLQREALVLGLSGWVCNLPSGQVLAEVQGPADAVQALIAWCGRGPPAARVDAVDVTALAPSPRGGFDVVAAPG